jgi:hypothetical protein
MEALIEPVTRGDPESPLRWTCKSIRRLADELRRENHPVGPVTVAKLLRQAGYRLQANRKTREGASHPDRNAQFEYINASVQRFLRRGHRSRLWKVSLQELADDVGLRLFVCHFREGKGGRPLPAGRVIFSRKSASWPRPDQEGRLEGSEAGAADPMPLVGSQLGLPRASRFPAGREAGSEEPGRSGAREWIVAPPGRWSDSVCRRRANGQRSQRQRGTPSLTPTFTKKGRYP